MNALSNSRHALCRPWTPLALAAGLCVFAACSGSDGRRGPNGTSGTPLSTVLKPSQDAPGVALTVLSIGGASGADGSFRVGDVPSVRFTARRDNGVDWDLTELGSARIMVSGPTFNYQRVIAQQSDLASNSVANADGSYTYRFSEPIPANYLAPLNDTPAFGAMDGELSDMPLLAGTYTVGMYAAWTYSVEGRAGTFRDVGNATADFLFGGATAIVPREVVKADNCNQCHKELQAHGGTRRDPALCILCHTSGSEDRNMSGPGGTDETPGASVDFRVMIHKIHSGKHLPSVLGIGVMADGTADYTKTPAPYELVGFGNRKHDYSEIAFPVWPSLNVAMPRDAGYSMLGTSEQAQEDEMRGGVVSCNVCHGDPDGAGPLTAPAQGELAYVQPSRRACGSCHDDVDWTLPYDRNGFAPMPANTLDGECSTCHSVGNLLPVAANHLHPLKDPTFNPGFVIELAGVTDGAGSNMNGTLEPGEKVDVTFRLVDDMGVEIDPMTVSGLSIGLAGPTTNQNMLLETSIPTAALTGAQPFTVPVPMPVHLEHVDTTVMGGALETFAGTTYTPVWNVAGAETVVYVATGFSGVSGTLAADVDGPSNFLDVGMGEGAAFARDDFIVIDAGGANEEYLRIQWVEDDRLWFNSGNQSSSYPAGTWLDHSMGELVQVVDLALDMAGDSILVEGVDFSVSTADGVITELVDFPSGEVLVSYTSDYVLPDVYPLALNASPDLDEEQGKWTGLPLADGTYKATMWGDIRKTLMLYGESNSYRLAAEGVSASFLVDNPGETGTPMTLEPWNKISSIDNCYACHQDMLFHGAGRRGVETCLICHGSSGGEDRPRYVAANAPETTGVEIRFREMLHKIHAGANLANAATYSVVGFGRGYPDNFSVHTYEDVEFPSFPDGVKNCEACHGSGNEAWLRPAAAEHPTDATRPGQPWKASCGSCHDSDAAQFHIDSQTTQDGVESCSTCHKDGIDLAVDVVHKVR